MIYYLPFYVVYSSSTHFSTSSAFLSYCFWFSQYLSINLYIVYWLSYVFTFSSICILVLEFVACLFVCLFICLFVCLFVCLLVCLFVCLFVWFFLIHSFVVHSWTKLRSKCLDLTGNNQSVSQSVSYYIGQLVTLSVGQLGSETIRQPVC